MPDAEYWMPNFKAPNEKTHVKQLEIYNCYTRYLLVSGSRRSGKTIAVLHRVLRHLWEVPGARVALVTKTKSVGKEGGVWSDLVEMTIPEWLASNMVGVTGMPIEYTSENRGVPGPRMDNATRTSSFRIRNYWGGESELIHMSLDNVAEVEPKFKGTRFSMIWFSELSEFDSRNVFTATIQQLRIGERRNQQFIADTNPSVDGEDSWIYKLWFVEALSKSPAQEFFDASTREGRDPIASWEKYRRDFRKIEVFLEDNPFLEEAEKIELTGSNIGLNQGDYDRNVSGKWRKGFGHRGKLFSDLVVESLHFIETPLDFRTPENSHRYCGIDISPATFTLYGGWDIGQVNNGFVIMEKRFVNDIICWCILDEVMTVDEKISTEEFTIMCADKMMKIEEHYDKSFEWVHWSDDTALNVWRAAKSDGYDAAIVERITEGWIKLQATDKPDQSVSTGIRMMRRALFERRFFIGNNCPKVQEMLMEISEGKVKTVDDSEFKHPFDAVRYVIYMEARRHEAELTIKPKGVTEKPLLISF